MSLGPDAHYGAAPADGTGWHWKLYDEAGTEVEPSGGRQEFPTRADAESWVGEFWQDLADDGVASVTLFEADREVYGPMSLSAG